MGETVAIAAVLVVIALSSAFLFVYGANLLYLSWRALTLPPVELRPADLAGGETVLVQLPIYNERFVATRVIDAVAGLDWPRDRLRVQVLDDSDDDTPQIVGDAVASWKRAGLQIEHIRRANREGYKAGALAHGLTLDDAPLVAVFDADFVPRPDFLRQMVPLLAPPEVGFAQARWGHLNDDFSLFTHLQSLMTDFHFLVEQAVRVRRGFLLNFTGSAGVWKRAAIDAAGGWSAATLTEDLDLSYRAQLRGWRAAYTEAVVVPQELPVSVNGYRSQQARWSRGSFQCAGRLLGPVLRSELGVAVKFQAAMHLLGYVAPLAMLAQIACYPALLILAADHHQLQGTPIPIAASILSLAPAVGMAVAQSRQGREWWRQSLGLLGWSVLGAGTSLTVAGSLFKALRGGGGVFERTPKYRIERLGQEWRSSAYFKGAGPGVAAELAFGLAGAVLVAFVLRAGQPLLALYAGLFATGYLYLSLASLVQGLRQIRYESFALQVRAMLPPLAGPAALVGAALLLAWTARLPEAFEDGYQHWLIAANLAATGRLQDPLFQMQDTWLPAYHVLAAALLRVFGLWQIGALKLGNAALGVATLALVYRLAGQRRRGLVAVALLALNPAFLLTATSAVAEPLLVALLVGAVAALPRLWLAALLAGLAGLTGTKAWLWLGAAGVAVLLEALSRRQPALRRVSWVVPALALAVALEGVFGFGSHSVARAAVEVGSASARGSVAGSPLLRAGQFAGFFALASPLLVLFAPLGLLTAVRQRSRLLATLYAPSLIYLGLVVLMVGAGLYTGSQRYYYPALPGLALLAAIGLERLRMPATLLAVGATAAVAIGYIPVLGGLAADNRGLQAAGVTATQGPGALLTDSPAVAYWSHKPPDQIYGSLALPQSPQAALPWLQSKGISELVLEDIDYYRAHAVLPELVKGVPATPPFSFLGDAATFNVPGGKRVSAYRIGPPPPRTLGTGVQVGIDLGQAPARGKSAPLAKGVLLLRNGKDVTGEGMGFGVPAVRYRDGWHYAGTAIVSDLSTPDGAVWRKTFDLDTVGGDNAHGYRFQRAPSVGRVQVTYRFLPDGIHVEVRPLGLARGMLELQLLNEQSSVFDDLNTNSGTAKGSQIGNWETVSGGYARFRSGSLGIEWEQEGAGRSVFHAGREASPPGFDWSGLDYQFGPGFTGVDYTVAIRRAR